MKKIIIPLLFLSLLVKSSYVKTDLDFLWNGEYMESGGKFYAKDSITDAIYLGVEFIDIDTSLNYLYGKSKGFVVFWGDTIPVSTIFSNLNYADTLFTQWIDQELNDDLSESKSFRIQRFAHYDQAVTDTDDFFKVPEFNSSAFDVGAGQTYTSATTALAAMTVGDTMYLYDGDFGELSLNKEVVIIGVGAAKFSSSATRALLISTNGTIIEHVWIDGTNATRAVRITSSTDSLRFRNCYIQGGNETFYYIVATNIVLDVSRSYVEGYSRYWGNINFKESLISPNSNNYGFELRSSGRTFNYTYCDIEEYNLSCFLTVEPGTINVSYSNIYPKLLVFSTDAIQFNSESNNYIQNTANRMITGTVTTSNYSFNNDNFNQIESGSGSFLAIQNVDKATIDSCTFNFEGVFTVEGNISSSDITLSNCASEDTNTFDISIAKMDSVIITGNSFKSKAINIEIYNSASDSVVYGLISENEIISKTDSSRSVPIQIGKESVGVDWKTSNFIIEKNFIHQKYAHSAIFISWNANIIIRYNRIEEAQIGSTFKGNGESFNSSYYGNIVTGTLNNQSGILTKGASDVDIYGNTVKLTGSESNYLISIGDNEDVLDYGSDNCEVYNNIMYVSNQLRTFQVGDDSYPTLTIDNNIHYSTDGEVNILVTPSTTYSFTQWQGLGEEPNSFNSNPNFKSSTQLWPTSGYAFNNGLDLGVTYNQGLDKASLWPNNVTLKTQPTEWIIGAYVVGEPAFIRSQFRVIRSGGGLIQINR